MEQEIEERFYRLSFHVPFIILWRKGVYGLKERTRKESEMKMNDFLGKTVDRMLAHEFVTTAVLSSEFVSSIIVASFIS